ncbi:cartilage oligomeric matrix protein [Coccinella septempunctata]|uniref:cartilage oligomeric matrix protein n=1 Tax=Coccinella septempunctata TaxID=41139 RepID=UPI001D0806DF|nr:cartilage oligomeric matrix protein [Coccinella septempunctata]
MKGFFAGLLTFLGCLVILDAVSLDAVITKDLQDVIEKDELILSLRHIKPKKRSRGFAETLFSITFPQTENKFALLLDRKTKRVIVETLEEGKKRVQHFTVDILEEDSTVKSLILAIDQKQPGAHATLYINCNSYGMVATPKTVREMHKLEDGTKVEVYHEKRYPMSVDGHRDVRTVLSMHDCPLELDSKSLNSFDDESFLNNYLKDDPNAGDPYMVDRGDIPSVSNLDEGSLLKALNELIRSVNVLYRKCGERDANIEWIRRYMEECDVCRRRPEPSTRPPTPPPPQRPTCATHPPNCFRGVRCYNTEQGPRCGPCPYGYTGNGYDCRPTKTCRDRPCYPGVTCTDTPEGYQCGSCPANYVGNGEQCRRTCRDRPCFPGVPCTDTGEGYQCGSCPANYEGNGEQCRRTCRDRPCYPGVPCTDTAEGFRCGSCPANYDGNGEQCWRTCRDRPCFQGVTCEDTERGFKCGACPLGFEGNGEECRRRPSGCEYNPCAPGRCIPRDEPPYFECVECPSGFEGNGTSCIDIDECALARPCDPRVRCRNEQPGYRCEQCPPGYKQSGRSEGIGLDDAARYRQVCEDIDECREYEGACVAHSHCINTPGSYQCTGCDTGYAGNQTIGCLPREGYCPDGTQCDKHAHCVYMGWDRYDCECQNGWAGDGKFCGKDFDLDFWPDEPLPCSHPRCKQDNCAFTPNSGQEDDDNDGIGNVCDDDADNDEVINEKDNCWLKYNPDQSDSDDGGGDHVGDACDNCPYIRNSDQSDTDRDGKGDACDEDIDNDGVLNKQDNCVDKYNPNQRDIDGDGIGDVCDNCPDIHNPDQYDADQNQIGDVCDFGRDSDRDGINDNRDNCVKVPNPNQLDTDHDGIGDACDDDIDGDGIINIEDNCYLVWNPDQLDVNRNYIGDVCEKDWDNDTVTNDLDNCPNNSLIHQTDFSKYSEVILDPQGDAQVDPNWVIVNHGAEILQTMNSDPGLAIGYDTFYGVDFEGTFHVASDVDDDYAGFIFSYLNNKQFYAVMWKKNSQPYWKHEPFEALAESGIQLKLINSATGPGEMLRNALWQTGNTENEVTLLWKDPKNVGWKSKTSYRWLLIHRPRIGLIRLRIYEGDKLITDSDNIFDSTLQGGRLGVFCFSQEMIIWSDLVYRCNEQVPEAIWRTLPANLKKKVQIDTSAKTLRITRPIKSNVSF